MSNHLSTLNTVAARVNTLHGAIQDNLRRSLLDAIEIGGLLADAKQAVGHGGFGKWLEDNVCFSDRTARRYVDLHSNRDRLLKSDTVTDLTGAYRLLSEGKSAALQAPKQSDFFDGKSSDDLHAFFTKWHDQFAGYVTLQDAMGKTAEEIAERCLMPGEDVRLVLNPRPPEIALFTDKSEGMRGALRAHNESVTADIAFHNSERFGRAARYAEDCGRGDLVPGLNAIAEHYRRQYSAASNWPLFYVWENCGKSYGTAAMMVACRAYRAAVGLEEWPHEGPVDLLGCVLQTNIELVESEEWKAQEMITGRTGE